MNNGYKEALKDEKSLALFLRQMAKFDKAFCEAMFDGVDYTLRLELRGDQGRLLHSRVTLDGFERPQGVVLSVSQRRATPRGD